MKETTKDKIQLMRDDSSLSQRELAAEAIISPATVNNIENNSKMSPHSSTIRKLAAALSVEPRDLRMD